jgi:2-polyprenyl-3-methyl-5-hydroxy-6-metoxy-1,4-benzoquinol methylase
MNVNFDCNLCGCKQGKTIPFRYAFKDKFLWGVKCNNCELVSIWPRPTEDEIVEMYASDYFTGSDKETHHMEVAYVDLLAAGDYTDGISYMKQYCKNGNILDVGCATGNFLYALKNSGYNVKGIELSSFAAEFGRINFGIDIINEPYDFKLLNTELPENHFDVVLMGDVLEHFTNPTEAMKLTYKILKPGGVALIQLPGTLNLLSSKLGFMVYKLIGSQKTMHIPPFHLTEFNEKTARRMFKDCGFTKINIKQEVKPPNTIPLRGNFIENSVKYLFQHINFYLTKWFGVAGDRIIIETYK